MLAQAVMHGGEYVIARQYMPELRRTTYKQFKEILPRELIIEDRIADAEIHIKSAAGGKAIFYFVGLDDSEKLRSLNLSGFGIDEASQVSEEAFLLLQSRLRNPKGLRKGILVGNPSGRDWVYRYFVDKRVFKTEDAAKQYSLTLAPSTENIHLPDGYIESMLASYSEERIQREIMGSFDAFEGQIYTEFNRNTHVIQPFEIPADWTRICGMDIGYTNPTSIVWGAIDYDGNCYIYREFYEREWLLDEVVKGNAKLGKKGYIGLTGKEKVDAIYVDPSTKATRGQTGDSDFSVLLENLPTMVSLVPANNEVLTGIDRVKSYLRVSEKTRKPRLFIFNTCHNVLDEITQYMWDPLGAGSQGRANEKEKPRKYNDHAMDALRYLLMSRPDMPKHDRSAELNKQWQSPQNNIQRELQEIKKGDQKDPFSGM